MARTLPGPQLVGERSSPTNTAGFRPGARLRRFAASRRGSWLVLIAALVVTLLLNIGLGAVRLDPRTIVSAISWRIGDLLMSAPVIAPVLSWAGESLDRIGLLDPLIGARDAMLVQVTQREDAVVWVIRVPRTLLGAAIGAGLAVAGATLQGIFRNPLADPGIIGVSAGAAVGAVFTIVAGITWFGIWTMPALAFVTALGVTMVVYAIARRGGRTEVVTLILAGVAISSMAGGLVGWLITVASDSELRSISFWQMGSLGGAQWPHVGVVSLVTAVGCLLLMRMATPLNLLMLGEREARHLGVRVERMRGIAMFTTAAMTAAAVSFAGMIGFVGLVVPHLVRLMSGPDHRQVLPRSAVLGAVVLMLADLFARLVAAPMELPIGVVMGIVGGPFFAWLLIRTRRESGGWA